STSVEAQELQLLVVQFKVQVAGGARINDPPSFPLVRPGLQRRMYLTIDHHQDALAAHHRIHGVSPSYGTICSQRNVRDHQHPFPCDNHRIWTLDGDGSIESGNELVCYIAMMMWVIPTHPRCVIDGRLVEVRRSLTLYHRDDDTVSLLSDMETEDIIISWRSSVVGHGQVEQITRRHPQSGTWQRAVIPQHKSHLACDTCRIWGCGQLHIQGAVGAFQYRWLLKIS